jgi:hypothetical protein
MTNIIREAFENESAAAFGIASNMMQKYPSGEYKNPTVEDHWQTFQEGWKAAVEHLKGKTNSSYSDLTSNGGMDPRNTK